MCVIAKACTYLGRLSMSCSLAVSILTETEQLPGFNTLYRHHHRLGRSENTVFHSLPDEDDACIGIEMLEHPLIVWFETN